MNKLLTALLVTVSVNAMADDATIKSKLQALGAKNIEVKDDRDNPEQSASPPSDSLPLQAFPHRPHAHAPVPLPLIPAIRAYPSAALTGSRSLHRKNCPADRDAHVPDVLPVPPFHIFRPDSS